MAPPQLISLENYSDVQFRDVVHRRSQLVAPTANVIQKMYHHTDGSTVRLSGAELLTTDAGGNVQYALMLGSNTRFLNGNTLTAANVSTWSANSIFTANNSHFTVRVPTLTANILSCSTLSLGNDVNFANVSASRLNVTGNIMIDTNTLTVDSALNRVGVLTTTPSHALDVGGNVNVSTGNGYRIAGTTVLSGTTLGSTITTSSLQSVGTLGTLSVAGTAAAGNLTTSGNLTATGTNCVLDSMASVTVTRTISGDTVGSGVDIGTIGNPDSSMGQCLIELRVTSITGNNAVSKVYSLPYTTRSTTNGIQRALPVTSAETPVNDVGIDLEGLSNRTLALKLVRTLVDPVRVNTATVYQISIIIHYSKDANFSLNTSWTPSSSVYNSPLPTGLNAIPSSNVYTGAVVTQQAGRLGVGVEYPAYALDVKQDALYRDNVWIGTSKTDETARLRAISTNHTLDAMFTTTLNRTISGSTLGSGVEIGSIGKTGLNSGMATIELRLTSLTDNPNAVCKSYLIPYSPYNFFGTQRALPLSSRALVPNDVGIDVEATTDNILLLRLVRTRVDPATINTATQFQVAMSIHFNKNTTFDGFTPSSAAYTSPLPETVPTGNILLGTSMTQQADKVGINTENPAYSLDVYGDGIFRDNLWVGTSVFDNTATLRALGTNHVIDCQKYYSANVLIPTNTVFSGVHVANVTFGTSCTLDIHVCQSGDANNTISKTFTIPLYKHLTLSSGVWKRALPVSGQFSSGLASAVAVKNDIDLDIRGQPGSVVNLALVRSRATETANVSAPITVSIVAKYSKFDGSIVISPASGAYTGFPALESGNIFTTTVLTSGANGVGLNVDPKQSNYFFDVNGRTNIQGGLNLSNFSTDPNGSRSYLSFGNKWRLYYNPTTENLEIQMNNDSNDYTWSSNVVTGILAAV